MNIDIVQISFSARARAVPGIGVWILVSLGALKSVVRGRVRVQATVGDRGIERHAAGRKKAISADAVSYPVGVSASGGGQNGTLDVKSTGISVKSSTAGCIGKRGRGGELGGLAGGGHL